MLKRNNGQAGWWRVGALGALVLLVGVSVALGQGRRRDDLSRRQMQAPAEAPAVDWADARRAFQLAENACIAGQVELAQAPTDRDYLWVSDVVGVRVTLRAGGTVMGVGEAFVPPEKLDFSDQALQRATPVVDLYALTRRATGQALQAVQLTLGDLGRSAAETTPGPGVAPAKPPTLAEIGRKLNVDLQVARWPRIITLAAEAPPEAIYAQWATGYHGLVSWRKETAAGDKAGTRFAWVWPATALAENLAPRDQIVQLLARLDYPITAIPRFGRSGRSAPKDTPSGAVPGGSPGASPGVGTGGIPAGRFRVIHVVRPGPGLPPTQLDRGNVVLPANSISGDDLAKLAEQLTQHLTHHQRADGWWRGTFLPTADKYDPELASAEEVALAAWALVRRANFLSETQPGHPQLEVCRSAVRKAVDALLPTGTRAGKVELSPAAAAFTVLLLVDAPGQAERQTERDRLLKELLALQQPDHSFRAEWNPSNQDKAAPANLPTQALLTLALIAGYEQTRDPALGQAAERALDAIWMGRQPHQLAGAMPWLALAEYHGQPARLGAAGEVTDEQRQTMLRRGQAILAIAQALRSRIVSTAPDFGPADVVGGMDLTRPGPDAPANPDWRTAQFLVLLARTLRDPAVSEGRDRYAWLLDCGLGFRFIQQLTFTQASCYYVRSPEDCLGGVRLSLWDNRVAVMPSAMALLAATELQVSILHLQTQP